MVSCISQAYKTNNAVNNCPKLPSYNLLSGIVALLCLDKEHSKRHSDDESSQVSIDVDIGSCKHVHKREHGYQDEKDHKDVPIWPHAVIIEPEPYNDSAEKRKNGARCSDSNRVRLEDRTPDISMIAAQKQQENVLLLCLHGLLNCEANHQEAKHIPEKVQEAVV